MTIRSARQFAALVLTGAALVAGAAAHAGPEVTLYLTLPLGGAAGGKGVFDRHVFGLRLDKSAPSANIRNINPESPLNRRPLLDLQLGADSALRLDLARRLTWDISRQELRQTSLPASFAVRLPVNAPLHDGASPTRNVASVPAAPDPKLLTAALANPLQNSFGKASLKGVPVEP